MDSAEALRKKHINILKKERTNKGIWGGLLLVCAAWDFNMATWDDNEMPLAMCAAGVFCGAVAAWNFWQMYDAHKGMRKLQNIKTK